MKIKDVQNDVSFVSGVPSRKRKPDSTGPDFEQLLREARATPVSPPNSSVLPSAGPAGSSVPISQLLETGRANEIGSIDQIRSQGIASTDAALKALERYQTAMADSRISLKQIEPFIRSLSQNLESMKSVSEKLSSNDSLRAIMTELEIVSSVEIERFDRGDYV